MPQKLQKPDIRNIVKLKWIWRTFLIWFLWSLHLAWIFYPVQKKTAENPTELYKAPSIVLGSLKGHNSWHLQEDYSTVKLYKFSHETSVWKKKKKLNATYREQKFLRDLIKMPKSSAVFKHKITTVLCRISFY